MRRMFFFLRKFSLVEEKKYILFDDRTTTGQPLTASDVRVPFWRRGEPGNGRYTESGRRRPETVLPGSPVAACGFTDTEFRGTAAAAAVFATQSKLHGHEINCRSRFRVGNDGMNGRTGSDTVRARDKLRGAIKAQLKVKLPPARLIPGPCYTIVP